MAVLTALALLLIQAPDEPPVQWECSRGIPQESGLLMVVRRLDADGAELARVRLAMPDWALARPEIGLARNVLGEDSAAYRTRCQDITIPVRVGWEVQPGR